MKAHLHHVYRSSAPFLDLSGHGTHAQGTNVGWSADGAVPQSGAAVLNGSTSRALVPLSPVWQDLYALRVDALVRFDPVQGTPGHPVRVRRHLVVEGPLSFAVFIGQERTVTGMVMGLLPDLTPTTIRPPATRSPPRSPAAARQSVRHAGRQRAGYVAHSSISRLGAGQQHAGVHAGRSEAHDGPGEWTRLPTWARRSCFIWTVYWRAPATTSSRRCCRCRAPAFTSAARPGAIRTRCGAGSMSCAFGSSIRIITPRSSSAGQMRPRRRLACG